MQRSRRRHGSDRDRGRTPEPPSDENDNHENENTNDNNQESVVVGGNVDGDGFDSFGRVSGRSKSGSNGFITVLYILAILFKRGGLETYWEMIVDDYRARKNKNSSSAAREPDNDVTVIVNAGENNDNINSNKNNCNDNAANESANAIVQNVLSDIVDQASGAQENEDENCQIEEATSDLRDKIIEIILHILNSRLEYEEQTLEEIFATFKAYKDSADCSPQFRHRFRNFTSDIKQEMRSKKMFLAVLTILHTWKTDLPAEKQLQTQLKREFNKHSFEVTCELVCFGEHHKNQTPVIHPYNRVVQVKPLQIFRPFDTTSTFDNDAIWHGATKATVLQKVTEQVRTQKQNGRNQQTNVYDQCCGPSFWSFHSRKQKLKWKITVKYHARRRNIRRKNEQNSEKNKNKSKNEIENENENENDDNENENENDDNENENENENRNSNGTNTPSPWSLTWFEHAELDASQNPILQPRRLHKISSFTLDDGKKLGVAALVCCSLTISN